MIIKFQYLNAIFPGLVLSLIFCLFSQGINNLLAIEIFGTPKSPISTVLIAILLGIIMVKLFKALKLKFKMSDSVDYVF